VCVCKSRSSHTKCQFQKMTRKKGRKERNVNAMQLTRNMWSRRAGEGSPIDRPQLEAAFLFFFLLAAGPK